MEKVFGQNGAGAFDVLDSKENETAETGAVVTENATKVSSKSDSAAKRREQLSVMKDELHEAVSKDPSLMERAQSMSNSVEVVNSLSFGADGNIVVDKEATAQRTDGKKSLVKTSAIVGYRLKNIGETPIKYQTDVYSKDENGVYVASRTEKTAQPGETFDLARADVTAFACQPEFSFTFANGKVTRGSGKNNGDLKAELEAYYFRFNPDKDGVTKQINDDEVKLNVGEKIEDPETKTDKWVVKAEFVETFGFLNNVQPKAEKKKKKAGSKSNINAQILSANHVRMMIEKGM